MASNIEIKARIADLEQTAVVARRLAGSDGETIVQEDIFFRATTGRLKLRVLAEDRAELIAYERPDTLEAKQSIYHIYHAADPAGLRKVLADALGETVIVRKTRRLFLVGQTRIHLDDVEGLGAFLELEVVLRDGQSPAEVKSIADGLMAQLGVRKSDLVSCAYADLLLSAAPRDEQIALLRGRLPR